MASDDRHVRLLRLNGVPRDKVAGLVARVEDALRVASLPQSRPGELLFVRRLDLGEIDLDAPSQRIARTIEALVRRLVAQRIHGEAPGADEAEVVWFRDEVECRALAIQRVLENRPLKAWFWRSSPLRVAPEAPLPPVAELLCLPTSPNALAPPPIVLFAQILERLTQHSLLEKVLERLPERGEWQRSLPPVWTAPWVGAEPPRPAPLLPLSWKKVLLKSLSQQSTHPRRTALLWTAALVRQQPTRAQQPQLPRLVAQVIHFLKHMEPEEEEEAALPASFAPPLALPEVSASTPSVTPKRPWPVLAEERPERLPLLPPKKKKNPPPPPEGRAPAPPATPPSPPSPPAATPPPAPPPRWLPDKSWRPHWLPLNIPSLEQLQPTGAGGLFFCLPVLERLKFPAWLLAREGLYEAGFAWNVLGALLRKADHPPEDPLAALCTALGAPEPAADPAPWAGQVEAWLSRLEVEQPLHWLLRRKALLSCTPTHLDMVLPIKEAEIPLRRWALDTDPGWVPYLGRVIATHYLENADFVRLSAMLQAEAAAGAGAR